MWYYCEVKHIDRPDFDGYKFKSDSAENAVEYFKNRWGDQLLCVYDDDFNFKFDVDTNKD